jgi:hypothetical protein
MGILANLFMALVKILVDVFLELQVKILVLQFVRVTSSSLIFGEKSWIPIAAVVVFFEKVRQVLRFELLVPGLLTKSVLFFVYSGQI